MTNWEQLRPPTSDLRRRVSLFQEPRLSPRQFVRINCDVKLAAKTMQSKLKTKNVVRWWFVLLSSRRIPNICNIKITLTNRPNCSWMFDKKLKLFSFWELQVFFIFVFYINFLKFFFIFCIFEVCKIVHTNLKIIYGYNLLILWKFLKKYYDYDYLFFTSYQIWLPICSFLIVKK